MDPNVVDTPETPEFTPEPEPEPEPEVAEPAQPEGDLVPVDVDDDDDDGRRRWLRREHVEHHSHEVESRHR